jgi:acetyl-CoA acetyltransferase
MLAEGAAPLMRRAAIVGVGQTALTRKSERSEWSLALEAILAACDDAGVEPGEIDGIVRYSQDRISEAQISTSLGLELRYHGQVGFGGQSAAAFVAQAAAAVASGLASVVLCYRALNGRSGVRYGRAERSIAAEGDLQYADGIRVPSGEFSGPYGLLSAGQVMALWAQRYAHEAGADAEQLTEALGSIAVGQRAHASRNPQAVLGQRPLDIAGYRSGRMISAPLRLFDLCLETDGAGALLVTSADRARDTRHRPAFILSASQALAAEAMEVYTEPVNGPKHRLGAERLFREAGIGPNDIDVAMLYDASTIMVLLQLEGYGFVAPGHAWHYVVEEGIGLDSPLPVNTSGGHLSEGYLHGINLATEAVRQVRGDAANPVPDAEIALFGAAGASGVVLSR